MKLLAIETSTEACSIGLMVDGRTRTDHRIASQQHGALALPMIDALMAEAEISPSQLDAVVFGRGPGSFTGVRIGVALTQGIALGADIGVIGISTLHSMAQGIYREYGDSHIAVSLDARMAEVYFAAFAVNSTERVESVVPEQLCAPELVPSLNCSACWVWAGSGAERYHEALPPRAEQHKAFIRLNAWPHAQDLLHLAIPDFQSGALLPPEQATPVYLRNKVAETTEERAEAQRLRDS